MKKAIPFLTALLFFCANPEGPETADNGTKTGNAFIQGTVVDESGNPAAKRDVAIDLYNITAAPDRYEWKSIRTVLSDSAGYYRIDILQPGFYSLFMQKNETRGFLPYFSVADTDSLVEKDTAVLESPKRVVSNINVYASVNPNDFIRVQVVGTPYTGIAYENGETFFLDSLYLPEGEYKMEVALTPYGGTDTSISYITFPIKETAISVIETTYADYGMLPDAGNGQIDTVIYHNQLIIVSSDRVRIRYQIDDQN